VVGLLANAADAPVDHHVLAYRVVIGKQIFANVSGVAASGNPAGGFAGLRN